MPTAPINEDSHLYLIDASLVEYPVPAFRYRLSGLS